jgi:hypothetical protein
MLKQTFEAVAAAQHPGWENLMLGCLIFGGCALLLGGLFFVVHPKRSTPFLRNAREWLAARLWPALLALAVVLFTIAAVAAIVR